MPQNKGTWIRFILLAVSLVSTGLVLLGKEPLEYDEVQLEQALTFLFTVGASVLAAVKNNDTTKEGAIGTEITRQLKRDKLSSKQIEKVERQVDEEEELKGDS